jgi:hypothetical protein
VPHLLKWLGGADPAKRSQAVDLLGRIGPAAAAAVPKLIAHLVQAAGEERESYCRALVEIGREAVPGLLASVEAQPLAKLGDDTWQARCLSDIGLQAVPALATALKVEQASGPAYLALLGLKNIGAKSATARQAILPFLEHEQAAFRGMALAALVASTAKPANLMPRLQSAMNDDNSIVRQSAMDALASLGPSARGVTSALVERLGDKDGAIQLSVVLVSEPRWISQVAQQRGDEFGWRAEREACRHPSRRVRRAGQAGAGSQAGVASAEPGIGSRQRRGAGQRVGRPGQGRSG